MISLNITPPTETKAPNPSIYDAYNHFMQGETAIGRATLAAYYRNGIDNPRATLYEAAIERKNINQIAQLNMMILPDTYKSNLKQNHYAAMKEINFPQHPMVLNAKKALNENFDRLYPSKKSKKFTKFVIGKTILPALNKFRCLLGLVK